MNSKKLSEKRREALFVEIQEKAVAWSVGIVGPDVIDEINILQATYEAMQPCDRRSWCPAGSSAQRCSDDPGNRDSAVPIIKGDAKSLSIAGASVLAKVTRDHMMIEYDKIFPEYGFAKHKGYGTAMHTEALRKYGPCPIHRRSFIGKIMQESGK